MGVKNFKSGSRQTSFFFSEEQGIEIDTLRERIIVRGQRGGERAMNKNEFFREGARHLARCIRDGSYKPLPGHRRLDEAEILRVLGRSAASKEK